MLGDLIYEEKGTTTGLRVLESENGSVKGEARGFDPKPRGRSRASRGLACGAIGRRTHADGSIHGDGRGFMKTKDGAAIGLIGSGVGRTVSDGVEYRGSIYFHTSAEKYLHLNTIAGVYEYDVDGAGKIANKIRERM